MSTRIGSLRSRPLVGYAALFVACLVGAAAGCSGVTASEPAGAASGSAAENHCAVTCGRFKDDRCEVWDSAGAPSCQCSIGDIGSYTECRCADGRKPTGCRCSNAPHAACDSHNPPDGCGSCQCRCGEG